MEGTSRNRHHTRSAWLSNAVMNSVRLRIDRVLRGCRSPHQALQVEPPVILRQRQEVQGHRWLPGLQSRPPVAIKELALRPGFGTVGMKCLVRANHFFVRAAGVGKITQYEISMDPEVRSRPVCRALMKELIKQFGDSHLGQCPLVYDGRYIFYTAGSLPFVTHQFTVILIDKDKDGG
ncbi:protein argonaute PNH1-like [Phalaenopsis equestris]|uniref:protein argonaute PNH1-like n=1 Tax=Phalaenopsis equestris TaxID=78828 RepID=UPI0009E3B32F|nr:protein argonaute PNH1-like [Phalaenopsis equestris]